MMMNFVIITMFLTLSNAKCVGEDLGDLIVLGLVLVMVTVRLLWIPVSHMTRRTHSLVLASWGSFPSGSLGSPALDGETTKALRSQNSSA